MNLKHVVNKISSGAHVQHRLLLGKHVLAEGLERAGTEAEYHLGACFRFYVEKVEAESRAKKEQEKKAAQSQGTLALETGELTR